MSHVRRIRRIARLAPMVVASTLFLVASATAADEEGFEKLFNGKDLGGWNYRANKTQAVTESFEGARETTDKRFEVRDGSLVANPRPEDGKRGRLWTDRDFPGDFVLKLEFRTSANADSGVFLRKHQVQFQVRDYPTKGPYYDLQSYRPEDWNELTLNVRGNVAQAVCNGEVLEEAIEVPPSGPIGLESDLGQVEFRNIRVKPLP